MINWCYHMKIKTSTPDLELSSNERLYLKKTTFSPKNFTNIKPKSFKIYTLNTGMKKKQDDLLVIIFNKIVNVSSVYSKTSTPSAPIIWDKINNKGKCKVLIVNSGNANAHTGKRGIETINNYVEKIMTFLKCKKSEVLVSSTGVIGEFLNPEIISKNLINLKNHKDKKLLDAAKAIMTTDTYPKIFKNAVKINNKNINIYGIAKGAGMIYPNMGTMLAYIFIDADISKKILNKLLIENLENSFNSISVDGDTSTSDTLFLFSSGTNKVNLNSKKNYKKISNMLYLTMINLAKKVVMDGEGISKLMEIEVVNAKTKSQATNIAFAVSNSLLVKTAISGQDANWGRVIMAIGKTGEKILQDKLKLFFGSIQVCEKGCVKKNLNMQSLDKYMKKNIINIKIDLGIGNFNRRVFGNDLTKEYLRINADYRS